jgi:hypothetical protein
MPKGLSNIGSRSKYHHCRKFISWSQRFRLSTLIDGPSVNLVIRQHALQYRDKGQLSEEQDERKSFMQRLRHFRLTLCRPGDDQYEYAFRCY